MLNYKKVPYIESIIKTRTNLVLVFLLLLAGVGITYLTYYLFSQVFYNLINPLYGGSEVFLLPRFKLIQNDLMTRVFKEWAGLSIVFPVLVCITLSAFLISKNKKISFSKFLILIYVLCFVVEILFVFISNPLNLEHIAKHTSSINNGVYTGIQQLLGQISLHGIKNVISLDSIKFLFIEMYAKISPGEYPFVGSTHPPGIFIIMYLIYGIGMTLMPFLSHHAAGAVTIALINTFSIVVLGLISREMFSERIAKLSCVMMITLPSVAIHFLAVMDGIASLCIGLGLLFLIYTLKAISSESRYKHMFWGLSAGFILTLAAQFTFGHAFPIFSLLVAFFICTGEIQLKRKSLLQFVGSLLVFPISYFLFEYIFSEGKIFYITMALERARMVKNGLVTRPYPLSQVANMIVMSVMGGLVFFPGVVIALVSGMSLVRKLFKKQQIVLSGKRQIRTYVLLSVFIMTILLLFQTTVRLEVERTWHWFFLPVWCLMGYALYGGRIFLQRLLPSNRRQEDWFVLGLCFIQLVITVILGISIQDYY